jgi:hypothetical protein
MHPACIRNDRSRGLLILIARLTAREEKGIFLFCHNFPQRNNYEKMKLATWEKRNGRIERQERTSRQHERLQARAGRDSEAPGGEYHHRARGECQAAVRIGENLDCAGEHVNGAIPQHHIGCRLKSSRPELKHLTHTPFSARIDFPFQRKKRRHG